MTSIDDLLKDFPTDTRLLLKAGWETLSTERQDDLLKLLPNLPGSPGQIQTLFQLAHQQVQMSFGTKHNVAIVGPANVGKSTLFNQLIQSKDDTAQVSPVPGTTRQNQSANAGPFTIVDTPGADAVGEVGQREHELALTAAQTADFLIIMFDAVQGIKRSEQDLFRELQNLHRPYIVVLNKMDLVRKAEDAVLNQVAKNLGLPVEQIIPIAAEPGRNLKKVISAIITAEPALVSALGQGLPAYRWQLAWRVISGAASTAGFIALTPFPFLDFIPLTIVQTSLILGIARIYNYKMTLGRWRELLGVLGFGYLGRTLFYEITKLGGPPAWVVSAGVAAGTTVAMGYATALWFERGERLTSQASQQVIKTVSSYVVESIKSLGKKRPDRQTLSERIRQTLSRSSIATDRSELDDIAD